MVLGVRTRGRNWSTTNTRASLYTKCLKRKVIDLKEGGLVTLPPPKEKEEKRIERKKKQIEYKIRKSTYEKEK
jgi:hypothetical protein